jgi:hypothetical protein
MTTSTYDLCLLVTITENGFSIVGMQTDDIIILIDESFSILEENELLNVKFIAKPKEKLILWRNGMCGLKDHDCRARIKVR